MPSEPKNRRIEQRSEERHAVAIPARLRAGLHLVLDNVANGATDSISDVVVTDISSHGLSAVAGQNLVAGMRVMVEIPVIGSREAEIRWIAGDRAGCRFLEPLGEEDLRAALRNSSAINDYFPGLLDQRPEGG